MRKKKKTNVLQKRRKVSCTECNAYRRQAMIFTPWSHLCHQGELAYSSKRQQEHSPQAAWQHWKVVIGRFLYVLYKKWTIVNSLRSEKIFHLTAMQTTLTAEGTATSGLEKCFWASKNPSAELCRLKIKEEWFYFCKLRCQLQMARYIINKSNINHTLKRGIVHRF